MDEKESGKRKRKTEGVMGSEMIRGGGWMRWL